MKRKTWRFTKISLGAASGLALLGFSNTGSARSIGESYLPVQLTDGNGGCLDLPSGSAENGAKLQIWACDYNSIDQTWFMDSGGAIHFGADPNFCIDLPSGQLVNQQQLQIWQCDNGSSSDQQWSYQSNNTIQKYNAAGGVTGLTDYCIELRNGSSANGTAVQLYPCNGTSGQTWFSRVGQTSTAVQLHDANGACLDLPNGNVTNGTKLQVWACDSNGVNQSWYMDTAGAIHFAADPNKCLDLPSGNLVNQTQLQIWDCDNGASRDQQWSYEGDQTIQKYGASGVAPGPTNYCMELRNGSSANGTPVQLFPCNGSTGQHWLPMNVGDTFTSLNVTMDYQQQSNWCWAASTQMVLAYHGVSVSQCSIVNNATGRSDCCTNGSSSSCNVTGWPDLANYGFSSTQTYKASGPSYIDGTAVPWTQLVEETQANRPVIFAWHWNSGGGHALVASGTESVNGRQYVTILDPINGPSAITYDSFIQASNHTTWVNYYDIHN
jgi:hypothetical protein